MTISLPSPFVPGTEVGKLERQPNIPLNLPPFPHRLRNSFTDLRSSANSQSMSPESNRPFSIPSTDATTAAAAIRWAAARVSVAPLALPSPEHELTDPMRGVTATIPGSHPPDIYPDSLPNTPGVSRKTRLSSFWQGTQDVDDRRALPTIEASPPVPAEEPSAEVKTATLPVAGSLVPPATAPVRVVVDRPDVDYFGNAEPSRAENMLGRVEPERRTSAPPLFDREPATVPALPRKICLTRQTSAPLPTSSLYERRLRSARPLSESSVPTLLGRAAKEENMFCELGFLAPPNPPDELERRRALYKFNIWNTGRDMNFDRIAHLVKLVFNPKIVTIALVDGTDEFLKSESGIGTSIIPRIRSFDAHAILQRDDEPTVVLDARDDWRFAKNPFVTGHPHIRFYAGCPLRTQDGFNIGTLSIIDDTPRREFSPRQRHTLKEFAQIAMRELELWRDKIQLRIRDRIQNSMEQFTRECLEVDKEVDNEKVMSLSVGTSMEQVYERAAKLVKRTLDVEGAIVLDVSHVDVVETMGAECTMSITLHDADAHAGATTKLLSSQEYTRLAEFFEKNPDGKICEGVVPATLRPFLPTRIQYALTVPIFNVDKRPFALLCAYSTGERTTPFLEGHELSYLRAIGVIILSAVLKRRMILADKAKSLFISNISHELRTPLHGILASAELLSETRLGHSQASFLQTVQACGTSLVETVNHVLDFTKLSGNAKSGGVENVIHLSKVDLMQLVEEATEGCWIGHRARMFTSEIGSVYSPPMQDQKLAVALPAPEKHVETVVDVGHSENGWTLRCEKAGIRRVLMNVFGNSLKFTSDGYVHVMLRQFPDGPRNKVRIELSVIDTGKGISQSFLKNQLFHPFSQENPLQTGTGLGLAIVNSIVCSPGVNGKVDVWSTEGVGTEIKITFTAEAIEDEEVSSSDAEFAKLYDHLQRPRISLLGFDDPHRGVQLLRDVVSTYLISRWGIQLADGSDRGEIVIVNEDITPVTQAITNRDASRPFIIFSSFRGDLRLMSIVNDYEAIGGFARVIYKPVGPGRICSVLRLCLHVLNIGRESRSKSTLLHQSQSSPSLPPGTFELGESGTHPSAFARRFSEERGLKLAASGTASGRPSLGPRAVTAHPLSSYSRVTSTSDQDELEPEPAESLSGPESPVRRTISVGTGGTLLKSSVGTVASNGLVRVLVVEDNSILRNLLVKWLTSKGYHCREAVDGQEGVNVFESGGQFDVVLVDLSMPVLDGIGATTRMRDIESARLSREDMQQNTLSHSKPARILALTGMSSLDDKRRAFDAGVDGYLVKPVAFKTLDVMFHKLGIS
ncbi:hypothetical protein BKA93DRAFT_858084 [Sparassis latifolia]